MTFHPMSKVDGQCPNCRAVKITMDGGLLIAIDWSKVKFVSGGKIVAEREAKRPSD